MNTEDGKLIEDQALLEKLVLICGFIEELQDNYSLNSFCPAGINLHKNGDTMFATVKDGHGNGEIILHSWKLEAFKDSIIY